MSLSTAERTVLPPRESLEALVHLLDRPGAKPATEIRGPGGETIVLPAEVFELLRDVVKAMSEGQAVTIAPVHQRLTTQEAAELLGISRPTLIKLLDEGEIAYEQPARHRRLLLTEVLAYRDRRSTRRRAALDELVDVSEAAGLYELTAAPVRTR